MLNTHLQPTVPAVDTQYLVLYIQDFSVAQRASEPKALTSAEEHSRFKREAMTNEKGRKKEMRGF